jgi:ubiquinone biosynthesis protein
MASTTMALDDGAAPEPRAPLRVRPRAASRWRFLRAYATTFRILATYLWLGLGARVFGEGFRASRITEAHARSARRLYVAIVELQGLFIKVGQLLSIMAAALPNEFRRELEGLQDQVPPRPYTEIRERIEREFGAPLESLYAHVEPTPIASASLGQVHEARLIDGRRVVVKVQHLGIEHIVATDLVTIRRILRIVHVFYPIEGLDAYYTQIRQLLREELDFKQEAANVERIAKNFKPEAKVVFPTVIPERSTSRVLTTLFIEGTKLTDREALERLGIDRAEIAQRLVRTYCQMLFVDGTYHADPHPGNFFVLPDGSLVLLDFGAVAELSPQMREGIVEFVEAILRRSTERILGALRKMGFIARNGDARVSEAVVDYFHEKFQEQVRIEGLNLENIKIDPERGLEHILDLRKMNIGLEELSHAFVIPRQWVVLERTILLLFGSCSVIDPSLDPTTVIRPYLEEFVLGNRDWRAVALETVRDLALGAVALPEDLRRYLQRSSRGEIEMRVRGLDGAARSLYAIGRQLIYTAVSIAAGFGWWQMRVHGEAPLARVLGWVSVISAVLLVLASFVDRPSRRS